MQNKNDYSIIYIIQIFISIISYMFGYPLLGSIYIITMAPLCMYLVLKKDAGYIPALAIHCMSQTSISFLILLSIVMICILNAKEILGNKKLRLFFLILTSTLPLFFLLTYQRMTHEHETWQVAFSYSVYYLSFWCFLYGYIMRNTYKPSFSRIILFSLIVCFILCNIFKLSEPSRGFSVVIFYGMICGFYMLFSSSKMMGVLVIGFSSMFFFTENMTFTQLITGLLGCVIIYFWLKKMRFLRALTGLFPYLIISALMVFVISTYDNTFTGAHSDSMDFSSWNGFWSRAQFKLFDDRAVFWKAAWLQIVELHPLLPMHDMPLIIPVSNFSEIRTEVYFGAHNTPLQLLRIFGIIMGSGLIFCYIKGTILGSSYLLIDNNSDIVGLLLIVTIISYSIVLFLTGTAAMLPVHSLFFFPLMGVFYGKTVEIKEKFKYNGSVT